MRMSEKKTLKKISSVISILLLSFNILFQNLCYSGVLAANLICTCSHLSESEKHSEDIFLSAHRKFSQENDLSLPECHRPKIKHSSHECHCKKGEERKRMISALFQMNLMKNEIRFIFSLPERAYAEREQFNCRNLFLKHHFRPPKFSSVV